MILSVVIGITSALVFGAADFFGGIASRRIAAIRVTAIAAVVGLAALFLALPFIGGVWSAEAIFWGALSGVTGAIAISLLYACLAIGPMSILSPLTAVVSAIVPMTWGLVNGERLATVGYLALGVALIAVVLVGFVPEKGAVRPSVKGVVMAIGSGASIGAFFILIDQTPADSGLVPLIMNRAVNGAIMFAVVAIVAISARRRKTRASATPGWAAGLRFAIICGVVDATANAGLLLSLRLGELTITSVLTALYPAGTIILAGIVLRERIAPVQIVGLGLALVAGAMFALA